MERSTNSGLAIHADRTIGSSRTSRFEDWRFLDAWLLLNCASSSVVGSRGSGGLEVDCFRTGYKDRFNVVLKLASWLEPGPPLSLSTGSVHATSGYQSVRAFLGSVVHHKQHTYTLVIFQMADLGV